MNPLAISCVDLAGGLDAVMGGAEGLQVLEAPRLAAILHRDDVIDQRGDCLPAFLRAFAAQGLIE